MRAHYEFDRQRFMDPGTDPADGYAWFLGKQLKDDDVVIFVAEQEGEVIGYVYAGLEPISWKELRDACGFVHDVVVDERGDAAGGDRADREAAVEWLRQRGAPRVMLWTAEQNDRRAAALREARIPAYDDRDDPGALVVCINWKSTAHNKPRPRFPGRDNPGPPARTHARWGGSGAAGK